ncbi:hypothetical protein BVX98_04305 [bacterium F11]|nr:hypothetical protein BVX98_04305 [bacterium F11]
MIETGQELKCPCRSGNQKLMFTYHEPPVGEIKFKFSSSNKYERKITRCGTCGHFLSKHDMDMSQLYSDDYVNSTYGQDGIIKAFNRINSLDPKKSDNVGRVDRILRFADTHFQEKADKPSVLDVGSGLCVFLNRIKLAGWNCVALDPDQRATKHAEEVVGIKAVCGDFLTVDKLEKYDVITFNKVLEHVREPIVFLEKAMEHLNMGGFIYLELPDGEGASKEGYGREEFFIDHHHIFSSASLCILATQAGLTVKELETLKEPSTKYTLRSFLVKN